MTYPKPNLVPDKFMKLFGLTYAEARVACVIGRGDSVQTAMAERHVSEDTVRNQLRVVFSKTDTHRQNELAALLLQVEYMSMRS